MTVYLRVCHSLAFRGRSYKVMEQWKRKKPSETESLCLNREDARMGAGGRLEVERREVDG